MCSFCIRHCYENELHMLFICPLYDDLRREYLSSQKYSYDELLNCKHKLRIFFTNNSYIIAKYLHLCFLKRSEILTY